MQELPLPLLFILLFKLGPERDRAGRHLCVWLIGTVGATHDARFTAGGSARIAGTPGVEEGDARAAFKQVEGSPAAEGSGADNGDVRSVFHFLERISGSRQVGPE